MHDVRSSSRAFIRGESDVTLVITNRSIATDADTFVAWWWKTYLPTYLLTCSLDNFSYPNNGLLKAGDCSDVVVSKLANAGSGHVRGRRTTSGVSCAASPNWNEWLRHACGGVRWTLPRVWFGVVRQAAAPRRRSRSGEQRVWSDSLSRATTVHD